MSQINCPCGRILAGDIPEGTKCPGCGASLQLDIKTVCTCCNGSGQYQPLIGPPEPCGTCKGEKFISAEKPKEDTYTEGKNAILKAIYGEKLASSVLKKAGEFLSRRKVIAESTPSDVVPSFLQNYVRADVSAVDKMNEFYKSIHGVPYTPMDEWQSESRIHRRGHSNCDIKVNLSIPDGVSQDEIDNLFRELYRKVATLGKVEGFQAKVGKDQVVLSNDNGALSTTWHHKPEYQMVGQDWNSVDFAQMERKAMIENLPLYYDPETGVLSRE